MAAAPWFPWYASDWLNDAQLRNCTKAQRGYWADVLSLMHMASERGILRESLATIAKNSRSRIADLRGLVAANVLRGSDEIIAEPVTFRPVHGRKTGAPVVLVKAQPGPLWFSFRMVKDEYKSRARAGLAGDVAPAPLPAFGASPNPPYGEAHHAPPLVIHPTRAIARESERERESEEIQGPTQAERDDPRGRARTCACEDDAQQEAGLTLQQAADILATAGLALQPHDYRVVELLRVGATGYELRTAAAKAARHVNGNWMPYVRATIEGIRADAARALAGTPVNGTGSALPKDYQAMVEAAARELAEFEASRGTKQ